MWSALYFFNKTITDVTSWEDTVLFTITFDALSSTLVITEFPLEDINRHITTVTDFLRNNYDTVDSAGR